jgi:hypothetical protein
LNPLYISDYLENFLISKITTFQLETGITWWYNIYYSESIAGPAKPIDCLNTCLNMQSRVCQFFVFNNGICFLGRYDVTNESLAPQSSGSVKLYAMNGSFIYLNLRIPLK